MKRIAIFHNYMDNIGGAEIVDLILARELNADIYTTNIDREKIEKMGFSTKNIFSIGKIPINAPQRQEFAYWKFRKLDVKKRFKKHYDFYIIAGDWAMSGARHNKPNLWYVYSPIREIYDLYEYTRKNIVPIPSKIIFDIWVKFRRILNKYDINHINKIIATSRNVQDRIKLYLKRNSKIIYPPIDSNKYYNKRHKNFWLSVNRLIHHKRIDMQLNAFSKLPNEKLIIVGSYEQSSHFKKYANYIKSIKPKNVEIKSWISEKELLELYANCKGFITTSKDEDFGLTPIEAMASGKPVIAPNEGGYKETITNKTGILIDKIDSDKIIRAIHQINKNPNKYKKACIKQAKKFDIEKFIEKIKKEIDNSQHISNNTLNFKK